LKGAPGLTRPLRRRGRFGLPQFALSIALLPWMLAGFFLSGRVGRRISARRIRQFLLALAAMGGLGILVKAAT
jgi:uncharacterized protein